MAKGSSNPSSAGTSKPPESAALTAVAESEVTVNPARIFVGGLGETVTLEDLRKIFSSLGGVEGVDIVRTKGRSFAYVDFLPSSHNSLSKLFSTYNGCSWKGGKLKLEKANEHYLDRLRREWAESAELADGANSNVDDNGGDGDKHQNKFSSIKAVRTFDLDLDKMQIRLFFPKLGKVKSLPFKGTGKHKYSFQRIQIPPDFSLQFCACPEHSEACVAAKNGQHDDSVPRSGEINEKEISMMKSIMNKLFERETDTAACVGPTDSKQDVKTLADENSEDDDDDLIINVAPWYNHSSSSLQSGKNIQEFVNKDKRPNGARTFEDFGSAGKLKTRKRMALATNKMGNSGYMEVQDEELLQLPKRKRNLETVSNPSEEHTKLLTAVDGFGANQRFTADCPVLQKVAQTGYSSSVSQSHIMTSNLYNKKQHDTGSPRLCNSIEESSVNEIEITRTKLDGKVNPVKEPDMPPEAQLTNQVSDKPVKGSSWLQKSSWTQLVGEANGGAFSISQILSGTNFEKLNLQKKNAVQRNNMHFTSEKGSVANKSDWAAAESSDISLSNKIEDSLTQSAMQWKDTEIVRNDKVSCGKGHTSKFENMPHPEPVQMRDKIIGISGSCPFMRNETSMRQWMSAKASLSRDMKKTMKKVPGDP